MTSLEEILAQAENPAYVRVATARILLRQDLVARHAELEEQLTAAANADRATNREPVAPALAAQILELEQEMEAAKVEFRFRAIGKRAWADLIARHPPTKDQLKADPRLDHNPVTFPVAAIAASCIDPELTLEDAQRLERALNHSQFDLLWAKVVDANIGGLNAPKSRAAGMILRPSVPSATTAASEEFPEASSLDES